MKVPAILGLGSAFPPEVQQSELWERFFKDRFANRRAARQAFLASGIDRRHPAINPIELDLSGWSTGQRMSLFQQHALPLATDALDVALRDAGVHARDLGMLAVASCTGYGTPGIDLGLAMSFGMAPDLRRVLIGHVGCHAALPALATVQDYVHHSRRPAALVCVELPSLHLQPPGASIEQAIVHALFSDAASAAVVGPSNGERPVLDVVDFDFFTDPSGVDDMTWSVGDLGFEMGLSSRVPGAVARHVNGLVSGLLARHGLSIEAVDSWAIHPGGPRVLDLVGEALKISEAKLEPSRAVLRAHGNCSSPTVLLVLEEILKRTGNVKAIVVLAFGPGLTCGAALVRARSQDSPDSGNRRS